MPIVNACLGGLANAIPSGQAKLNLTWITNDGENQQVTFVISGTASKSIQSDANGYASVQLPVGTYTVSVTHGGEYLGDDPKTITLTSRGTGTLTWLTGARQAQQATITSPGPLKASSVSYTIGLGSTTVQSGSIWNATMTFNLYPGSYTLTLTAYGDTITRDFVVPKTSGVTMDLADQFCMLSVSDSESFGTKNISVRGYTCTTTTSYSTNHVFYVLRSSKSASIGGTVNTPTPPKYSGIATNDVYNFSVSSPSVTPDSANKSVVFQVSRVSNMIILASGGDLNVPNGNYEVLINGGGGARYSEAKGDLTNSGGYYNTSMYGPFGGEIKRYEGNLNGSYPITIGSGGVHGNNNTLNGSASSFGTLLSANGGTGYTRIADTTTFCGVSGGAPGMGGNESGANQESGMSAFAVTGDVGGGGGGGGVNTSSSRDNAYSNGGKGGTGSAYGGDGGRGGGVSNGNCSVADVVAQNGNTGKIFLSYGANGGEHGSYRYGNYSTSSGSSRYTAAGGGGGGGGGYGASGGNGCDAVASGYLRIGGAGGGGGGAYGGDGGNSGSITYVNSTIAFNQGSHGKGYGSGAGGQSFSWETNSTYDDYDYCMGGGGGGGIGSSYIKSESSPDGAPGCVLIRWLS